MKLPIPWRWRSRGKSETTSEDKGSESASEKVPIDISVSRECIYQSFEGKPGPCPRCGDPLRQSRQTYLIATCRGNEVADNFIASNEMGWFCGRCPTVVINPSEVHQFLQYSLPHWDVGDEFVVAGIVNLNAVPEDKHDLPLGEDDNPIPLVPFTNLSDGSERPPKGEQARLASARKRKKAKNKKHKRRR